MAEVLRHFRRGQQGVVVIYAVTVNVDLQTLDPTLAERLIGRPNAEPGVTRRIPGGVMVFESALISNQPGEPSLLRFVVQFGALRDAALVGNWLFNELRGSAAALSVAGHLIPLDHHTIIASFQQVA
jgi:hypothetical protein